jgi:tRNA A37 methylthiotransferase MiaB
MAVQSEIGKQLLESHLDETVEVLIERQDPLTDMYIGRAYMHAPDNVDGTVRFHGIKDHRPGQFAWVRLVRIAGLNYIGKETEHA